MLNKDKKKVKIMVFGTFDGVHKGHLNLFSQARKLAREPFLIVLIARDKNVFRIKSKKPMFSEKQRLALVKKCKLADKVILGNLNNYLACILREKPSIIALGYDQKTYTKNLKEDFKNKKFSAKIIRLKPYKEHIYKNNLLRVPKSQCNQQAG